MKQMILGLVALGGAVPAFGQLDQFQILVDRPNAATNGIGGFNSLGATGYDPATDTAYTATFGANMTIRKTTNVAGGAAGQVSAAVVSESQLRQFYLNGEPDRGISGSPIVSSIVLNPKPVGTFPANSFAIITDTASTLGKGGATAVDPAATKRVYRWNLQAVPAGGDARDVMTSLVTLADMNALQGQTTNTSSATGRQGAFSSDGQSYYFIDSGTALGGVYKTNVLTGATSLLVDSGNAINTEPGVLPLAGGGDRILFQGSSAASNVGGLSYVDHATGGTTSAEQVLVSAADVSSFLERAPGSGNIFSVTTDDAGNVYFFDQASRVLVRRDTQGRLSKLATHGERTAFRDQNAKTGNVVASMLRLQTRTVNHPTAGQLTQVLYAEQTAQNYLAGVFAFEAGDFNRDGARTAADIALFKPVLTTRGVLQTITGNFKYDVNGNTVVDWKDVKLLQPFYDFGDGDVDINGIVDFADFVTLRDNFGMTGKTFVQADLDGDNDVDIADFEILRGSLGDRSTVLTGAPEAPFDQAQWDAFVASIPEPSALSVVGLGMMLIGRRSRRGR